MDREGWRAFAKSVELRESAEGEFAASDVALPIHVSHLSVSPILQISQNFANFRGVRLRSFA